MDALDKLRAVVWKEEFWLPRNVTWNDMKSQPGRPMPEYQDLLYVLPITATFVLFRVFLESFIMEPLARAKVEQVGAFRQYGMVKGDGHVHTGTPTADRNVIQKKKDDLMREKALLEVRKIRETGYKSVLHSILFLYGIWTMADKPWLRNTRLCFVNVPFHGVPWDVWWYYILLLAFYVTQLVMLPFDVKRNDYLAQTTHHVVTIGLMVGSWISNATRIGSIVLIVHECADVMLQCGKLLKYFKKPDPNDIVGKVFVIFSATWILTRVIYFPVFISIPTTEAVLDPDRLGGCFIFKALAVLLWILFILHLYWTTLLIRAIYNITFKKKKLHDNRSGDEESDEDDVDEKKSK
ncbi:unnamed protein product [Darwinula stevensoni]|uniref:TLC domain-containing protein n=1 Tax=Darwinula stevensoni TaxID=69355 RepID=A0A7R9FQI1_9CRUS|nr:unnamed protein product [Darwinula stevensoni]CAG0899829.1 unnamed protein product [Darwinula stevensoni]